MDQDSLDGLVSLPCFQAGRPVGKFGNLGDCGVHGGYEPRCRFRIASRLPLGGFADVVAGGVIESNDHDWPDRALMPCSSVRTVSHG